MRLLARELISQFPRNSLGNELFNLPLFGHNFLSRNVRSPVKPAKDSYYSQVSNRNLSQKLALRVGAQGPMMSSKMCKPTPIMTSSTKIQNFPFFKTRTTHSASLEGLNSSLDQSAGELWPSVKMANVTFRGT